MYHLFFHNNQTRWLKKFLAVEVEAELLQMQSAPAYLFVVTNKSELLSEQKENKNNYLKAHNYSKAILSTPHFHLWSLFFTFDCLSFKPQFLKLSATFGTWKANQTVSIPESYTF